MTDYVKLLEWLVGAVDMTKVSYPQLTYVAQTLKSTLQNLTETEKRMQDLTARNESLQETIDEKDLEISDLNEQLVALKKKSTTRRRTRKTTDE